MSRIRTIKPEFPQSETIGKLSRDARLLFIQLWTFVDDEGRARAASRMLASLLYPYDDDARKLMDGWLDELESEGCIRRYVVDGSHYLEVVNWSKHQKIDRPSKSRLPTFHDALASPREPSTKPREASRALDADLVPSTLDLGPSSVLDGRKTTRPERDEKFEEFKKAYPKRKGGNPWKPARALFDRAVKAGSDPNAIIAALHNGIGYDTGKRDTEFIPQAVRWLCEERWRDFPAPHVDARPAYLTPPPGCQPLEEFLAEFNGVSNGKAGGAEVRSDAGVGKGRTH
jgi:hypothetical protein